MNKHKTLLAVKGTMVCSKVFNKSGYKYIRGYFKNSLEINNRLYLEVYTNIPSIDEAKVDDSIYIEGYLQVVNWFSATKQKLEKNIITAEVFTILKEIENEEGF